MTLTDDQIDGLRLIEKGMKKFFINDESRNILRGFDGVRDLVVEFKGARSIRSSHGDRYGLKYALETGNKIRLHLHDEGFHGERWGTIDEGNDIVWHEKFRGRKLKFKYKDYENYSGFWFEEKVKLEDTEE